MGPAFPPGRASTHWTATLLRSSAYRPGACFHRAGPPMGRWPRRGAQLWEAQQGGDLIMSVSCTADTWHFSKTSTTKRKRVCESVAINPSQRGGGFGMAKNATKLIAITNGYDPSSASRGSGSWSGRASSSAWSPGLSSNRVGEARLPLVVGSSTAKAEQQARQRQVLQPQLVVHLLWVLTLGWCHHPAEALGSSLESGGAHGLLGQCPADAAGGLVSYR